jgi:hypothetical protein
MPVLRIEITSSYLTQQVAKGRKFRPLLKLLSLATCDTYWHFSELCGQGTFGGKNFPAFVQVLRYFSLSFFFIKDEQLCRPEMAASDLRIEADFLPLQPG